MKSSVISIKMMYSSVVLSVLVNTVIQSYFQNSRCMFLFYDNFKNFEYRGNIPIVNIKVVNQTINDDLIFQSYGCQVFIISNCNASNIIVQLENRMKLHTDRFNFRKYLIIPETENSRNLEAALFGSPILQYIVNFLLIIPDDDSAVDEECEDHFKLFCKYQRNYKLLTHSYVGKQNNNAPKILDIWFSKNKTFLNHNHLYPDKIANQEGRVLRCATLNYKPYSIIETIPTVAKGFENNIANEYIKNHNMTLQYLINDEEKWGIIYDNWTGNGIMGNIVINKADIGYGSLSSWEHEYGFLDFSKPSVRTGISCLVPAPKLADGWLTPFFPFSLELWICTIVSFLVVWLVIAILTAVTSKQEQHRQRLENHIKYQTIFIESFLRVLQVFLVQSMPSTKNVFGIAFRYMSVIFLFGAFITSTYSSGLASVMTIPRYKGAINTVQDFADSGMHWGAPQDAWILSMLAETRPQYVTLLKMFITASEKNLIEFSKTNNFAFPLERLPSGQFAIESHITEDIVQKLRLLHEDLYWDHGVFMLTKSSPLLDSFDLLLLKLVESGLVLFWEMKAAQIHMDLRVQNIVNYYTKARKKRENTTVKLKWKHVEGTFGILIVGYIISTLVFFKELIEHKCKKINKSKSK